MDTIPSRKADESEHQGVKQDFGLSAATARALEFSSLLALFAELAATDLGARRLSNLRPFSAAEDLEAHRRRYEEAQRLVAVQSLVSLVDRPLEPLLGTLEGGGRELQGRDLVEIRNLLEISTSAARRVGEAEPPCQELSMLVEALPCVEELRQVLHRTFDGRGEIRENATPRLAALRGRLRSVRQQIYDNLRVLSQEHSEHLSEDTIPMRGGRLVLVLQAGARGRMPGLIHGRSGRGKSFYFEPLETVERNNQLQQTSEEEEAEKRRILVETISRLRTEFEALKAHAEFVALLDVLQASVRFAEISGGRVAEIGGRHTLELRQARHPLLDPRLEGLRHEALGTPGHTGPIVPLDLEVSATERALVVTGPNAGGKTVALKTLGLLALAHQCGLPIPAAKGTRIPLLSGVVATVGDDQDLLADRSTFSGRLLRLQEAWNLAGPDALILLDELGSGTDPDEGAALATAILEGLLERRSLVMITTHLGQVAACALEAEGATCAATLFDAETGRPTYRLATGPPGGSEAIALARRMGLPAQWLDRAEEFLGSDHRDLRRLLAEVESARQELAATQSRLDVELADAEILRRRLAEQDAELSRERKMLAKTLRKQLDTFRDETLLKLGEEVERLRSELEAGRRKGLAADAAQRLFEDAPAFEESGDEEVFEVALGATVRHRRLGWTGTIEKLERGRAQVRARGKSLKCRAEDLLAVRPEPSGLQGKPRKSLAAQAVQARRAADSTPSATAPRELKLIGERVEPALEALDRFLDRALLASLPEVRVIHGHGSGRLRAAVREHLRSHRAVSGQRPGRVNEGGDGATVVTLSDH